MKVFLQEIYNIEIINDLIILEFYYNYEPVYPGQFFMIGPISFDNKDFILNRPFSVANFYGNILQFRIRLTGRFTKWLYNCKKGDKLRLIGPLGSFLPEEYIKKFNNIILVGGGIGVAPLIYFKNFYNIKNFVAGFYSKEQLYYLKDVSLKDAIIYTEDGSFGERGFCTDFFNKFSEVNTLAICCGPKNMYKTLKKYSKKIKIKVLMEEKMACGFGVCLGCVVNTINGFKRICVEGPIFNLNEIEL